MARFLFSVLSLVALASLPGCVLLPSADNTRPTALSETQIAGLLHQQHRAWKGVRYRTGGTSRKGVDCSGFVYLTYKDRLSITLPRSTEQQSELGRRIDRDGLRAGDLVFFKTGRVFKDRHVGMYLGDNRFLHASTSRGVMISSLDQPYWDDAYWQSRRVLRTRD